MVNKRNVTLTEEQYRAMINAIRTGFPLETKFKKFGIEIEKTVQVEPNERVATILFLEANLGLRIADVLNLRLSSFIQEGDRYRLDIVEKKTGKTRTFTVPIEIYTFIQEYAINNGMNPQQKLFVISERAAKQAIQRAATYLGY